MSLSTPFSSPDGKKLYAVGATYHGELFRVDLKSDQTEHFLGGISAEYLSFSKDGQWVAYVSYPEGTLWRSRVDGSDRLQLTYPPGYAFVPRWSPDGKTIVYFENLSGQQSRIYQVSSSGGTPQLLLPEDPNAQEDPNWSPDGSKIVFGANSNNPTSLIRVLDLTTHQVTTLPGSRGLFSPRWSADGRYMPALSADSKKLLLFDFQTEKWTEVATGTLGWLNWSRDGKSLYFLDLSGGGGLLRLRLSERTVERVVRNTGKNFVAEGRFGASLSLAPDDSPLLLRHAGTQDVYVLDWEEP